MEIKKVEISMKNPETYQIMRFSRINPKITIVPRRLFFTALQWIAIAQGPKIRQKNKL